jgi:hypothetical protein
MDTLLRSVVASWAKHTQRFLAAMVQLYTVLLSDTPAQGRQQNTHRPARFAAAQHDFLHPP